MRPKIVLSIIGTGLFVVIGLSVLRTKDRDTKEAVAISNASKPADRPTSADQPSVAAKDVAANGPGFATTAADPSPDLKTISRPANVPTTTQATGHSSSGQNLTHEEYVEQRVGELMDLGMTDDPEALKTILSEINNNDEDVRKAAVEAAKQFGSTDAIPKLEEALASAQTVADKRDLQEAIEFLKLPSFVAKRN